MARRRDAEAELNLPPGFRFHPTDEELVVHYLCRKLAKQGLPIPIIADVDLYKYEPWDLPEKAFFGEKEWYFFTPRDRKYPNGSRPNRSAGRGYWKATGADKPVCPEGSSGSRPLGIKKALVFYHGKAPRGVKTDWIMHEYRLVTLNRTPYQNKGNLRLDDWVLCRLYNKKNAWKKNKVKEQEQDDSDSFRTIESDVELPDFESQVYQTQATIGQDSSGSLPDQSGLLRSIKEDNDWFQDLNLDDLQNSSWASSYQTVSGIDFTNPDTSYLFNGGSELSPTPSKTNKQPPFF